MNNWIIRGYYLGPNMSDKAPFSKQGQYVTDAVRIAREAIQSGCSEIVILKRGKRDGKEESDYDDRVRSNFAVDSGAIDG